MPLGLRSQTSADRVVVEGSQFNANHHHVDTTLVGCPEAGSWLLVFLGAAREVLDPETAITLRDAVMAVGKIMNGETQVEHLFEDLVDRQPQVPEHLAHLVPNESSKEA